MAPTAKELARVTLLSAAVAALAAPARAAECPADARASVPCGYERYDGQPLTAQDCTERSCCWATNSSSQQPVCVYPGGEQTNISTVHIVMACHFDAGFADFTTNILNRYFDKFFPMAFEVGEQLRERGGVEQLRWMTQSWIVGLYIDCPPNAGLHCPSADALANFTLAVQRGYITWHAFPFNAEPELYDTSLFNFGIDYTHQLDAAFKLPSKATLSQRDVPGMTRSVIPLLVKKGVAAITVGVNGASTAPNVPPAFLWKDPVSGKSMPAMWHPHGYGGIGLKDIVVVPGLDHALALAWKSDNDGPPSVDEVLGYFSQVRAEFPGADVVPSIFDDFVPHLAKVADQLPVVDREIGDTWMHGAASDPKKMAALRAMQRARTSCIESGQCDVADPQLQNFSRFVLKNGEHTWGLDIKTFLHDTDNWSNDLLAKRLADGSSNFRDVVRSWEEQRQYGIDFALQALGPKHKGLLETVRAELAALRPALPNPLPEGFVPLGAGAPYNTGRFTLAFDSATGALSMLLDTTTGQTWATPDRPVGLLQYASYDEADYARFFNEYIDERPPPDWANLDFGKPNVASAAPRSKLLKTILTSVWVKANTTSARTDGAVTSFYVQAAFTPEASGKYGAPAEAWVRIDVPDGAAQSAGGQIFVTLATFNQTKSRLPEGMFFTFNPDPVWPGHPAGPNSATWLADKLGEWVDPLDVQFGGSQQLHGVLSGIQVTKRDPEQQSATSALTIGSLDAGLVCFGPPTAFPVPTEVSPEAAAAGASFVLFDNTWGTNYPAWLPFEDDDADLQWRFTLTFSGADASRAVSHLVV